MHNGLLSEVPPRFRAPTRLYGALYYAFNNRKYMLELLGIKKYPRRVGELLVSEPRRESYEVTLRKFFRDVQQNELLTEVKRRRYFEKDLSRKLKRSIAKRKAERKRALRGW